MFFKNAYESRDEYSLDGKRLISRDRKVGAIVVWGLVLVLIAILDSLARVLHW